MGAGLVVAVLLAGTPAYGIANGEPVAAGAYGFAAHLRIGDVRACSGTLVGTASMPERRWVLTAASCFAQDGRPTRWGPPPWPTTVTVGRSDLLGQQPRSSASVPSVDAVRATDVISHPDRDVALVRLASPVTAVTPASLAASPAAVGAQVRVAGYGRTATEWVPDRLHSGAFTVQAARQHSYDIAGSGSPFASLCEGDAGAPVFGGGTPVLYGLVSTSSQAGCLTETGTGNGATAVRVHDLGAWIDEKVAAQPTGLVRSERGDLTGDGHTDLVGMDSEGRLWLYPGLEMPAWFGPRVQIGTGWASMVRIAVGEFTGDSHDDVVAADRDGRLWVYPGQGAAWLGSRIQIGSSGWATMVHLEIGNFNGDAYDDVLVVNAAGELWVYPGRSDGKLNPAFRIGRSGWAAMVHLAAGEFDEDARDDVLAVDAAGKLWLYPGLGTTGLGSRVQIGSSGWATMRTFTVGEFNRDAYNDVLVFDQAGKLWLYPGTETPGTETPALGARVTVGEGGTGAAVPGEPRALDGLGTSVVEGYRYPNAEQILAEQNVKLISGDGHILLADCATPPQGDIGLLKVYTTEEEIGVDGIGRVCFKVRAPYGFLDLEVPGVFEIRGDGLRTGTGHEVTADLRDDDGEQITVDLVPDGSTQVGLGGDAHASPTMLLRLTVTG
ncbi:FG-GAP-like repeat-containing protein [Phytohabitans kaempferiae]|uniref:FG-GAP-like repeat-containing protein n=1 Tax=Phytohabitans kaempferiae TaxID=1620943 RepID=A0ABV6M502_9ACTN